MSTPATDFLTALKALPSDEAAWLCEHATHLRNHFAMARPSLADCLNELCILASEDIQERPQRARAEVATLERMMAGSLALPDELPGDFGWSGKG